MPTQPQHDRTQPRRLALATGNPHKVEELRALLAGEGLSGWTILTLQETGATLREPDETGATCEENALIKARGYAGQLAGSHAGLLVLADDSGIEVDALGGKPGVISSHYASDGAETGITRAERDKANNARVLRELEGVPEARRGARFVCVMALARVEHAGLAPRVLHVARGAFPGRIGLPPRVPSGGGGFGYDPLFLVAPDFSRTASELPSEEKNRLSHRGAAARDLAKFLRTL